MNRHAEQLAVQVVAGLLVLAAATLAPLAGRKMNAKANADVRSSWAITELVAIERARLDLERRGCR